MARYLLYDGPSLFNNAPILVLLSTNKGTSKTRMDTAYILPRDINPIDAARLSIDPIGRADESVCGGCGRRPGVELDPDKRCFVTTLRGPHPTWVAHQRNGSGAFDRLPIHPHEGARIGGWGDPSAVPTPVWWQLEDHYSFLLGYTQAWEDGLTVYSRWCMASVMSPEALHRAQDMGWRTFRSREATAPILPGEFSCPASREENHRLTCDHCKACDGLQRRPERASGSIIDHGLPAKR
jgi:hypothetical protein